MLLGIALHAPAFAQALTPYRFSDLGTLGGSLSAANDLNNLGEVVGYSTVRSGEQHAVLWQGRGPTFVVSDLGPGHAQGINDRTVVVGQRGLAHATAWIGGTAIDLGTFPDSLSSVAFAVNQGGQVAGSSFLPDFSNTHAALWPVPSPPPVDLGLPRGISSGAQDINARGDIVGGYVTPVSGTENSTGHAALWRQGVALDLAFGDASSFAAAINDDGVIVGVSSRTQFGPPHATVWEGSNVSFLDELGRGSSQALDINNRGQIVGTTGTPFTDTSRATLWEGDVAIDLNTRLRPGTVEAGWVLTAANAINDRRPGFERAARHRDPCLPAVHLGPAGRAAGARAADVRAHADRPGGPGMARLACARLRRGAGRRLANARGHRGREPPHPVTAEAVRVRCARIGRRIGPPDTRPNRCPRSSHP
jgi:probable HAF family extracellular repeat protein